MGKYNNIKVKDGGYTFDSKAEHRRWLELRMLERAGEISNIEIHQKYPLVVNGVKVCIYIVDFRYKNNQNGDIINEDVKSKATITAVYRLKKKLMLACYGITLVEYMT